jgi:hypothetical protein
VSQANSVVALKRANTILQEEPIRKRYGEIMEQVRSEVIDEQKSLPKDQKPKTGALLEYEIKLKTHKRLLELEEYNKTAEKYRNANEERDKMEEEKKKKEVEKEREVEKEVHDNQQQN